MASCTGDDRGFRPVTSIRLIPGTSFGSRFQSLATKLFSYNTLCAPCNLAPLFLSQIYPIYQNNKMGGGNVSLEFTRRIDMLTIREPNLLNRVNVMLKQRPRVLLPKQSLTWWVSFRPLQSSIKALLRRRKVWLSWHKTTSTRRYALMGRTLEANVPGLLDSYGFTCVCSDTNSQAAQTIQCFICKSTFQMTAKEAQ